MYLGIDFLITPELKPYVIEINVGLPGGAQEYHLTHLAHYEKPSDIFEWIEETSLRVYGKPFKDYLHSLPFIENLKPFKIWMDGKGPFPGIFHPGLRLEDKWIQYQLIHPIAPMPETMVFDPSDLSGALRFLERWEQIILKRRVGRADEVFKSSLARRHLKIRILRPSIVFFRSISRARRMGLLFQFVLWPLAESSCVSMRILPAGPIQTMDF